MTTIERALHDAMTSFTEDVGGLPAGTAHRVLRRSRRTRAVQVAAATTGAAAAVAGVGVALAASRTSSGGGVGGVGSGGEAGVSVAPRIAASATTSATQPSATTSAAASPAASTALATALANKAGHGSAAMDAVTGPERIPGTSLVRLGTGDSFDVDRGTSGQWARYIQYVREGTPNDVPIEVIVIDGQDVPRQNVSQSPSPSISSVTVNGRPATLWVSGGDRYLSFTAGSLTVEVFSPEDASVADMKALAASVQGLPAA